MGSDFYAFGEILWDCLPSGKHAGGAPFNVAAHLAQLGVSSALISAVGQDALGDEILTVARDKQVKADFITRARIGLATGTVIVAVDENGNATYELVQPAAWDEIMISPEVLDSLGNSQGFIYGSLAGRSPHNIAQLDRLLAVPGPLKFFDVNLRPPFVDPPLVLALAKRADVLKLNHVEAGCLSSWIRSGKTNPTTPRGDVAIAEACAVLSETTGASRICVTLGEDGAALWQEDEKLIAAKAPPVGVRDTVGAGDAFMAGLMVGLTRGDDPAQTLRNACRLGAFVASQNGATPLFPRELIQEFNPRAGDLPPSKSRGQEFRLTSAVPS